MPKPSKTLIHPVFLWLPYRCAALENDDNPIACTIRAALLKNGGEKFAKILQLRHIESDDIRLIRMQREVILVVILGRIKLLERNHLGDNRLAENPGLVQLIDKRLRPLFLFFIAIKNRQSILG